MDAATGLLYVGNGQYYDPVTGRFLTRDAKPNSTNPYVPWDPTGALLGPLGLLALVYGRKKKGSKAGMLLVLLLVGVSVGMTLAACGEGQQSSPTAQVTAVVQPISSSEILVVPIANGTPGTPFVVPVPPTTTPEEAIATACATAITPTLPPTSTPTPAPTPIPIGSVGLNPGWGSKLKDLLDAYKKNNNNFTVIDFTKLVLSGEFDSIVEDSGQYNDSGFRQDVAHAATHWLYINQKELSENALLNWLGAMDSAHTRYFGWISTGILGEPGRGEDLASYVVNQMLNPPEEWKRSEGDYWNGQPDSVNQHPYTWGNRSLWTVDPAAKLASLHYPPPVRTIPGGDSWYLLTLAQSNALHPYKR